MKFAPRLPTRMESFVFGMLLMIWLTQIPGQNPPTLFMNIILAIASVFLVIGVLTGGKNSRKKPLSIETVPSVSEN